MILLGFLLEGALVIGSVMGIGFGLAYLLTKYTRLGKRARKQLHQSLIQAGQEVRCPIHGLFPLVDTITTEFGEVCPRCYTEFIRIPGFTINQPPQANDQTRP